MNKANNAVPSSRKVNGKALTGDISLSAGDVGAFKLGLTGTYSVDNQVPWNADTGLYDLQRPGDSQLVAHFYNGSGSCPAFQLRVVYRNGGIAYRSARDSYGFEEDWTNIYTTKNKPSAEDVGAFPGFIFVNSIPTRSYVGAWGGSGNGSSGWVKGLNIGTAGSDVGQLYIDPDGNLYAYFLNNNGFTRGGAVNTYPVGSPIPWPQPNPPSGYLACNGQTFNKSTYPQLAAAYPNGRVPDLRGEFIRGWDDNRGVDSGRGVLSYQEGQAPVSAIAGYWDNDNWKNGKHRETGFSAATGTDNGGWHNIIQEYENQRETRPRNVAFNYIVRAA
ncbi:phage tail protein [Photorhabdus temperata subsp. temperata]